MIAVADVRENAARSVAEQYGSGGPCRLSPSARVRDRRRDHLHPAGHARRDRRVLPRRRGARALREASRRDLARGRGARGQGGPGGSPGDDGVQVPLRGRRRQGQGHRGLGDPRRGDPLRERVLQQGRHAQPLELRPGDERRGCPDRQRHALRRHRAIPPRADRQGSFRRGPARSAARRGGHLPPLLPDGRGSDGGRRSELVDPQGARRLHRGVRPRRCPVDRLEELEVPAEREARLGHVRQGLRQGIGLRAPAPEFRRLDPRKGSSADHRRGRPRIRARHRGGLPIDGDGQVDRGVGPTAGPL